MAPAGEARWPQDPAVAMKFKKMTASYVVCPDSLRARVDECTWCHHKRQGWCDNSLCFYCEHCWGEYDTHQGEEAEEYAGKQWHEEILAAENIAAESDDVDSKVLEAMRTALQEIDSKRKTANDARDSEDELSDHEDEVRNKVPELKGTFSQAGRPIELSATLPELHQAHVIVIVDTSGSMRTVDVKPDEGSNWVSRMAAVTETLSSFFQKQAQAVCPHRFSLISFSEKPRLHFKAQTAAAAATQVKPAFKSAASRGTHFVSGLDAAKKIFAHAAGTPHLLIFSDGRPADGVQTLKLVQDMMKEYTSLRIHAIGFGDGLDFDVLQQLTSIGRGTFAPSGRSIAALHGAFASVTSTITKTQTVTSRTSKSSTFSFQGGQGPSSGDDVRQGSKDKVLELRSVCFEPANQFFWGNNRSVSFQITRRGLNFTDNGFREWVYGHAFSNQTVSIRLQPFTEGGMRLVYCFKDSSIPLHKEQEWDHYTMQAAGTDARMVAKLSRYVDAFHNSYDVVSAYAKSSALAKWYSRIFTLAAADRLGLKGRSMAKIIFVECYIYEVAEGSAAPTKYFVGERYLPGAFLKYNSNHGYVNEEAPDTEIAQAFSHFTFDASAGKYMVLDLQGVYMDKAHRRRPHMIMTDPQVVSLDKNFGPGDLGVEGMRAFFNSHTCGNTCQQMKLDPNNLKRLRHLVRKEKAASSTPETKSKAAPAATPVIPSATVTPAAATAAAALPSPTPNQAGSIKSLRSDPAEAAAPPRLDSPVQTAMRPCASSQSTAGCPTGSELGPEGRLLNRHPAVFGAKTEGPLSAVMARSPAVSSGRPDFDAWLQSHHQQQRQQMQQMQQLQQQPLPGGLPGGRPPTGRTIPAPPKAPPVIPVPATQVSQPAAPVAEPGSGKASPTGAAGSQTSSSSLQSAGGSSDSTADRPKSPQQDARKTIIYGPGGQKLSASCADQGDVVKAIVAQWSIPDEEQLLFQESSSQAGTDFFRLERKMDPRKLRFTQASISPTFRDGRPIFQLMNDLNSQEVDPLRELEPLDVVWHEGYWRSLSNRRLWTLKHCTAAMTDQKLFVRVRVRPPDAEFRTKLTSTNDGVSVLIMNRARSPSPTAAR
ncbi:ak1 [Symbiodinium sp. CCMP2592]|nr:ak1 [Symbiodinium sp. CCMP2592]